MQLPARIAQAVLSLQEEAAQGAVPAALYHWPTPMGTEIDAVLKALPKARLVCVDGQPGPGDWKTAYKIRQRLHVWYSTTPPDWLADVAGVVLWLGPDATGTEGSKLWPPDQIGTWHSAPTTPLDRSASDGGVLMECVDRLSPSDQARWALVARDTTDHDWIVYTHSNYWAGLLRLWAGAQFRGGQPVLEYVDAVEQMRTGWSGIKKRTRPRMFVFYDGVCCAPSQAVDPVFICWQQGMHVPILDIWTCLFTWGGTQLEKMLVRYKNKPPTALGWT